MSLRPASFCVLLLLAGCATHTEQPPPKAAAAPVMPTPAGVHGAILAMRPVPAEPGGPARILLSSLGGLDAPASNHIFEFIVRTDIGTTISIVQPQAEGLHVGERVSILRGGATRIEAPTAD
jgi:hypothetical protein